MKNNSPTVSVAMPTYNGGKYLREQLDSIYNQTKLPDEVIVVDDCSTDNTVAILKEYQKKYGLKYYINIENIGYNKNFERAISLCSSDYIALSDQDDIWLPDKIEKSYNKLREFPDNEPSLVSSFNSTDINILNHKLKHNYQSGDWKLNLLQYYSQGCTLMFNRELKKMILPIPNGLMYDAYIGFTAVMCGNRFYVGEQLMYYRIHENNTYVSSNKLKVYQRLNVELNKHLPFWFGVERKRYLQIVKDINIRNVKKERIELIDSIISLYEVNKTCRLLLWLRMNGIPH